VDIYIDSQRGMNEDVSTWFSADEILEEYYGDLSEGDMKQLTQKCQ